MINNIRDPNIAKGFQALMGAFVPNSGALIEADMNRKRADGIVADTNRTNVDATRLAADRARLQAQAEQTQGYNSAAKNLAAILSDPKVDLTDPAIRGQLAAAALNMEGGLQHGPSALTGATTFTNPDFAGSDDALSKILMGTGVTSSYGATPSGFAADQQRQVYQGGADNANRLDVARANNDANMDRTVYITDADNQRARDIAAMGNDASMNELQYKTNTPLAPGAAGAGGGGGAPATVTPGTAESLAEMLAGRLATAFPSNEVPPALLTQLTSEAAQLYQTTKNADAAIAQVLSGLAAPDVPGRLWGTRSGPVVRPVPGGQPAPTSAAPAPTSAAPAPTSAAPTSAAPSLPTRTDTNGGVWVLDPAKNQWVPVGPRAGQP